MENWKETLEALLQVDRDFTNYLVAMQPTEAQKFLERAMIANNMPTNIEDIIAAIGKVMPTYQYGENNPNNGTPMHEFMIGREGSRVLYVHFVKSQVPADFDYRKLADQLEKIGKKFKADEIGWQNKKDFRYEFRFWWD